MSSAYSITRAVNPPRAVFLDFLLGHTAGKANDKPLQRRIMIDTLSALDSIQVPGTIRTLPYRWSEDESWKDHALQRGQKVSGRHSDHRVERFSEPQYQHPEDQLAAEAEVAKNGCPSCIWLDET